MMLRIFVIGFNASIATGMAIASGWLILQFAANRVWESGFYGLISPVTQAFWWAGLMVFALASITTIATLGYMARLRWGAHALFALSLVYIWSLPSPLSWLSCICAISVALEAATLYEQPPPEEQI
jgi:hypothetical protein